MIKKLFKIKNIFLKTFLFIIFFNFTTYAYSPIYNDVSDTTKLLACVIYAEAGIEDRVGKAYVADSILNRVNSTDPYWPDSIEDVVYQKGQYACVSDGNLKKAYSEVTDECFEVVIEELNQITNTDIIYFRTKKYSKWGTPLFKHGNHYFSKE